jgi:hypothetical protein
MVFTTVFIIIWIGSLIITVNTKLLGGTLSLLQCMCLLGYCIFPIVVSAFVLRILLPFLPGIIKFLLIQITLIWAIFGKIKFIQLLFHLYHKV